MKNKFLKVIMTATAKATAMAMLVGFGGTSDSTSTSTGTTTATDSATTTEAETSEEVVVTEMSFIFADGDEGAKAIMNTVVNGFNESHPEYNITIQAGDGSAYSEIVQAKVQTGEFPDIVEMRDTAIYVRAGMLEPISPEVEALFQSTVKFDGVTYTAPMSGGNTMGIIYNAAYFAENGLEEPTTWDEFIALCDQIKALGDMSPLVVGASDVWHMGFLYQICYGNSVTANNPNFIADCYAGTEDFLSDNFREAMEDLTNIISSYAQTGWASTADAQIATFLVNDMSAMMCSGTHMFDQIAQADPDFEMGWFPIPDEDGKLHLIGGGGASGWALSAESAQDPTIKAGFDAFMMYFFEPANYKTYCETISMTPTTVADTGMEASPIFQEVLDAVRDDADTLNGVMWNGEVGDKELPPDFRNFVYKTVIEIAGGSKTLDAGIAEIQTQWEVAMGTFNPVTGVGIE